MKAKITLPNASLEPRLIAYFERKVKKMDVLKLECKVEKLDGKTFIFTITSPIGTSHLMFQMLKGELKDFNIQIEKIKEDIKPKTN